ncbi:MAG: ATP-binding protein [Actinomycetota bacterium]|nr:ATP-binding protein [Actinomycetota bacterium]
MTSALEQASATVRLEIPPQSAYVAIVRLATTSLGRAAGLDEERLDDLKIAVSEACANAVLSTQEAGADDPITISITEAGDFVEVIVGDAATIEVDGDVSTADSQGFSTRRVMSTALLKSLVDEFELAPRAGGGTQTRLMLRR